MLSARRIKQRAEQARRNLIEVGADYIIPNYLCRQVLLPMLFANHEPI